MGGGNLGVGCGRCVGGVGSSGLDVHEQLRKCKGWGELTILRHCSALPIPSLLFALANPSCRAQHPLSWCEIFQSGTVRIPTASQGSSRLSTNPLCQSCIIQPPHAHLIVHTTLLPISCCTPPHHLIPNSPTSTPQPLQLPQHHQIRIQKPVHALPHARLLVFIQLAVLDAARGDALAEARVCEAVDS